MSSTRSPEPSPPEPSQSDKFKALARELEADEDETRWDERLKKVVVVKPEPSVETPKTPK